MTSPSAGPFPKLTKLTANRLETNLQPHTGKAHAMANTYILASNQNTPTEETPCDNIFDGLVAYGKRVEKERDALKDSTPTKYGSRYFFVAIYDGGRQLSWTIRQLREGGAWDESTLWKFGDAEDEIKSSTGTY